MTEYIIWSKRSPGTLAYHQLSILAMPSMYVGVLTSRCYPRQYLSTTCFNTASRLGLIYEPKCGGMIAIKSQDNVIMPASGFHVDRFRFFMLR